MKFQVRFEAIRNTTTALTGLAVLLLSGCVQSQLASKESNTEAKRFTAPADISYVYVVRRKAIRLNGVYLAVSIDREVVGKLGNRSYLLAELTPGHHEIEIRPDSTAIDHPIKLELETLPGRSYFIVGHMTMGRPDMKVVSEEDGKALLRDTRFERAELLQ